MRLDCRALFATAALAFLAAGLSIASAQQVADTSFAPPIRRPAFSPGQGPVVAIDEAHGNFHTLAGRYAPFAALLRRDGFVLERATGQFTDASLTNLRVLVIANALHPRNAGGDWSLPTPPAFTPQEIASLTAWVARGGALLLIADHMPFPGANQDLAAAFGFHFRNGFVYDDRGESRLTFRRADTSLADHAVVRGRSAAEAIDHVATFTGSGFRCPPQATSLLVLPRGCVSREPPVAWKFDASTPTVDVSGWSQGAVATIGRGRLAVFGEAAMFTAQRSGPTGRSMGMNDPSADQNAQFLLNVIRWLAGVID